MDPTKTNSYRRWRNKSLTKGFSGAFMGTGELSNNFQIFSSTKKADKSSSFRQIGEESEIQRLLIVLEEEYRKNLPLRRAKALEIKKLIQKGLYHVPGKLIVDKWFPK